MTEPNDIPERVSRLERSVAEARKDAAAARILAGGADRDVSEMRSELRTHTTLLNALRETQVDQAKEMREGFARSESRFAKVEGDMREGFARTESRFAKVEGDMREGFAQVRSEMSEGLAQVRGEMGEGLAQVRGEMSEGFAQVRGEMSEGFAQMRGEMGEGFAVLKKAIDKSNES